MKLFRGESGNLTLIYPGAGPEPIRNAEHLFGHIPDLVDVIQTRQGRGGEMIDTYSHLTVEEVRWLFCSETMDRLPLLKAVVLEPVIFVGPDGSLSVSKPGFNTAQGVFYHVQPPSKPIEPSESLEHLTTCFSGVPFESPEYRNSILAYLLGAIIFDPAMDPPLLSITGNSRGIGKSSLAQGVGFILTNAIPAPIDSTRGDEFAKQVGTRFAEGSRFIFIDNIVRTNNTSFHNERLASMLTQGYSKRVRQLGYSRSVAQAGTMFCLSMNSGKLDSDLATRSLAVKLYANVSRPMNPYVRDYAMKYRREIYAELLGLALRGPPLTTLTNEHTNFRFRRWLSFVSPRIQKHFGPLAITDVSTLDDLSQELFEYGQDHVGQEFTAEEFLRGVTHSAGGGLPRYPSLSDKFLGIISEKGRTISAGRFLCAHVGHTEFVEPGHGFALDSVREATSKSGGVYIFKEVKLDPSK
jgi:hypothetical protein